MKTARLALLLLFSTGVYLEADWPQWRGPTRNGVAPSSPELVAQLSEEQELPLVWESEEIPSDKEGGHGSIVVADERVYLALVWRSHRSYPKCCGPELAISSWTSFMFIGKHGPSKLSPREPNR